MNRFITLFLLLPVIVHARKLNTPNGDNLLYYQKPAMHWLEALPIGNGALGAMIDGGLNEERIQFNESSLQSGTTKKIGSYLPFGNVYLKWGHQNATGYSRKLDISKALHTVDYKNDGISYHRDYFASYPDKAIVFHVTASKPGAISVEIKLKGEQNQKVQVSDKMLSFKGKLENDLQYESILEIKNEGGSYTKTDSSILIKNANALTLYLVAGTSFKAFAGNDFLGQVPHQRLLKDLNLLSSTKYSALKSRHINDFSSLFNRVQINLGVAPKKNTIDRLKAYANSGGDPALEALLFQYGRYLLISASRPGGVPANLQGIWNQDKKPAWYSQYTTNINVQMNYWPAGPTNLGECEMPLFAWIENLAAVNRGSSDPVLHTSKGWVAYSTNNIMGGASTWRLHRPGSAWLSRHFWEYYCFTGDIDFLRKRAYPLLKELTEYWQQHLIENKDGKLISPDGWSPEHGPGKNEEDKKPYPGASYDQQIVYNLFSNYLAAAKILKLDSDYVLTVEKLRAKMLGPQIGKWGQLQEWMEDVDDPADHHRHNSHLFAVYPGNQISMIGTPAYAKAATKSLLARGDKGTGWAITWRINLWARLFNGDQAHGLIQKLIQPIAATETRDIGSGLYPNLFDVCPPFQIDGNFGYTAGVAELLLQSDLTELILLPALPSAWKNGSIKGLKARGNVTVNMSWKNNKLVTAELIAATSGTYNVRYLNKLKAVKLSAGKVVMLDL